MSKLTISMCLKLAVLLLLAMAPAFADNFDRWPDAALSVQPSSVNWGEYCGKNCDRRCSKARVHNRCLEFCRLCCDKCHCVPPGTYGRKDACPCYRDWKTKEGGPKCP